MQTALHARLAGLTAKPVCRIGLAGRAVVSAPSLRRSKGRRTTVMRGQIGVNESKEYPENWLRADPLVFVLGFMGWTVPTTIGVPILNGSSFFGQFMASIGSNLAHFPTGPKLDDPFWLYLTVYHAGLFLTLLLGQIGVQGRRQGYWG
eukprot:jgi/Astpho2/6088/Aster-04035